jgi:hypothetical protein
MKDLKAKPSPNVVTSVRVINIFFFILVYLGLPPSLKYTPLVYSLAGAGAKIQVCYRVGYSVLRLFTGFAIAAFIAWKLTVITVISNAPHAAAAKIHHDNSVLY